MSKNELVKCGVHYKKNGKVKGDKYLGTDENGNRWQIFRDGRKWK